MTVHCIGLPKTGTTSLKEALKILGFQINGSGKDCAYICYQMCIPLDRWKTIYNHSPEDKFILTYRDFEDWWRSIYKWSRRNDRQGFRQQRLKMYGHEMPMGINKTDFYKTYNDRLIEVKDTIPTENYLIFKPEYGWDMLCQFLGKEIPKVDYPYLNRQK